MRVALFLAALCLGCQTQLERQPARAPDLPPVVSTPSRAWEVVVDAAVVGVLVEFATEGSARRFFSVRNPFHQELGLVDELGRVWRYRAPDGEADWLGSATVIEGTARVLGLAGDFELLRVPLERLSQPLESAKAPAADALRLPLEDRDRVDLELESGPPAPAAASSSGLPPEPSPERGTALGSADLHPAGIPQSGQLEAR